MSLARLNLIRVLRQITRVMIEPFALLVTEPIARKINLPPFFHRNLLLQPTRASGARG
jgi:hypothetical protein